MLKFIVDTQLPPSLIKVFQSHNLEAIHTTSFTNGHLLDDQHIRIIAVKSKRIIVTKDTDFLDALFLRGAPPKVLLIETGNIKNRELFGLIEKNLSDIVDLFSKQKAKLVILDRNKIISY